MLSLSARKRSAGVMLASSLLWLAGGLDVKAADAYYNYALQSLQRRDYKTAYSYFAQSYRTNPKNPDAIYYQGFCRQNLGDNNGAATLYASVLMNFPASPIANQAAGALQRINPGYFQQVLKQVRSGSPRSRSVASAMSTGRPTVTDALPSDYASLPNQSKVYYTREGNLLIVPGYLNGREQKFIYDTGAEVCSLGFNHLDALQIARPQGNPTGGVSGVGSTESIPTWGMHLDIKIGTIERRNFPCIVQKNMPVKYPLLGETFFHDFTYTIDKSAGNENEGSITFVKRGAPGTVSHARDNYSVPFVREGNEIVVPVEVNGKQTQMYFDTGAHGVTFTRRQLEALGIKIPDDAAVETSLGVGGQSTAYGFNVARMKCGPIDKSDVRVSATDSAKMNYGLLGQNFFGDWQVTVDYQSKLLHFLRR